MKTAVVTGASGFIGRALVRELVKNNYYVYALVRRRTQKNDSGDPNIRFITCDLSDLSHLKDKIPTGTCDMFYHLAWEGTSGPARADVELQLRNALWTVDALRAAKELGCNRFICAGSIMEYETMSAVYSRGCRPGAGYIYGGGKLTSHVMCASTAAQIGVELVWPMLTNAYGPGERSPRLVNSTIRKCLRGESPKFTSGTQNYDFVYIDDAVRGLCLIGEKGKPFHEYLIGSSQARPLKEFLWEMQAAVAPGLKFQFGDIPFSGVDLPLERFDCSRTEADTGFRAEVSFAEGCRRTMAWWKQQEEQ